MAYEDVHQMNGVSEKNIIVNMHVWDAMLYNIDDVRL